VRQSELHRLTRAAVFGALYAAVTLLTAPISFGALQCRISEALCILPFLFPETAWGLFGGCLLANLLGGSGPLDVIFGSLATLLGALMTSRMRWKWLAALPPVIMNGLFVGAVLAYTATPSGFWGLFPLIALEVAGGEAAALYALGIPLLFLLLRIPSVREKARKTEK